MAQEFHLRLITERAGGGDPIIRERHLPQPQLTIGRATDSDILLTDLTVDPEHAVMRFAGPGRVIIESVSGASFQVGGRSVQRADIDVANHPVVMFATYTLAFETGPEGGTIVTVTHAEHEHHPTPSIFSLQSKVFGRRKMAWTFGAGIFLICLLVPLLLAGVLSHSKIHPDQQWSSGPLSKSHAFLEQDCKACHAKAFVAVRDASCKACHQASHEPAAEAITLAKSKDGGSPFQALLVYDHADPKKLSQGAPLPAGFGAKISTIIQRTFNHPTDRCASCHVEHTKPGQKAKGLDATAPLSDKPDQIAVHDCQACHTGLKARLGKTELIDTPTWDKHPAFRPLIMTSAQGAQATFQRMALTSAPQERNGLIFPHRMHLDSLGGVARQAIDLGAGRGYGAALECASCHLRDKGGKGFEPIQMEKACGACHSLAYAREGGVLKLYPHGEVEKTMMLAGGGSVGGSNRLRPGEIRASALPGSAPPSAVSSSPFRKGGACFDCHTITWTADGRPSVTPVKLAATYMPRGAFDHATPEHGGPGQAKAGGYKCADCHKASVSDHAADVLIPDIGKCNACHGQPKTKTAAASDGDCATCHSFHAPGKATPKPGRPALETLRWSEMMSKAAV